MKRPSPATLIFAVLAVIATTFAIQAQAKDTDAKPAPRPAERAVQAEPAAVAPAAAATGQPTARATAERAVETRRGRTRNHRRPAARFALPSNRALAAQDCREESFDDAAEFRFTYGQGKAAIRRCTRDELNKARADCRADEVEDPFDYRAEYGSGRQGLTRCVRDSLT